MSTAPKPGDASEGSAAQGENGEENELENESRLHPGDSEDAARVDGDQGDGQDEQSSRMSRLSTDEHLLRLGGHLDVDIPEPIGDVTLCSSSSGTISQEGEDYSRPRQSAHVAASARAELALDARSAAQAAVDTAEIDLKRSRFRTASDSTTGTFRVPSTRRRAEEYLGSPSISQTSGLPSASPAAPARKPAFPLASKPAAGAQGARAWHQGLARQKAEVEASVQDYRRLLLKSLKTLSQVKSALYDADERSLHLTKGAEVMLPEVWDVINSLLQGDLGHAAAMQSKAEEEAKTHQDLKAKLRVSSAALEVEAALTSCDELRGRIEEVQSRLAEIRGEKKNEKPQKINKAQAHSLIRSFTAILIPQLPDLVNSSDQRTASEATTIHFLQAATAAQNPPASPGGQSALAQARADTWLLKARGKP